MRCDTDLEAADKRVNARNHHHLARGGAGKVFYDLYLSALCLDRKSNKIATIVNKLCQNIIELGMNVLFALLTAKKKYGNKIPI